MFQLLQFRIKSKSKTKDVLENLVSYIDTIDTSCYDNDHLLFFDTMLHNMSQLNKTKKVPTIRLREHPVYMYSCRDNNPEKKLDKVMILFVDIRKNKKERKFEK